jgi:mannitol/fructose-specific phosphotransferase system IIA component (Ntr-type)/galactitol-specific phosphotransferase system IIB component
MVIEAVRRSLLPDTNLDELAETLGQPYLNAEILGGGLLQNDLSSTDGKSVVLAVCITGKGAAIQLQKEIERQLDRQMGEIEIICIGLADRQAFVKKVCKIMKTCRIKAVVGTLDPVLPGVPFITVEQMIQGKLSAILQCGQNRRIAITEVIQEELIFYPNPEWSKPQILDLLTESLLSRDLVKPEFTNDVIKRELIGVPILSLRVAIPHGEDPRYVKQTAVALAIFPEAIPWGENYRVNVVCLFAIATDGKEIVQELGAKLTNDEIIDCLIHVRTPAEAKCILLQE